MDRFSEQLLSKQSTGKDTLIRVLYVAAAALLASAAIAAIPFIGPIVPIAVIAGVIWALVWLMQGTFTEYEYIVTNDDLDIDKITGKRKRKRMVTVSLSKVKEISEYVSGSEIDADVTVMAHDETGVGMYYLICEIAEYGRVAVVFNPDKRTLYNMIGGFDPRVRNQYSELYSKVKPADGPDEEETQETQENKAETDTPTEE